MISLMQVMLLDLVQDALLFLILLTKISRYLVLLVVVISIVQ